MPLMDGVSATREIRSIVGSKLSPHIVAVTANVQQHTRQDCAEAGMNGFIAKPFTPKDLKENIEEAQKNR